MKTLLQQIQQHQISFDALQIEVMEVSQTQIMCKLCSKQTHYDHFIKGRTC